MSQLKKPLIALLLAIIPFFVFLGSQNTVRVNGVVTTDNRFNVLGVILGLVAIGMAFSILRSSASGNTSQKVLGALAGLAGAVQLASAVDAIRVDPWDWMLPDRNLPVLQYAGPGLDMDGKVFVTNQTAEGYKNAVRTTKVDLIRYTRSHMAYADLCHGGRYRVDTETALQIPDYFSQEEKNAILNEAERRKLTPSGECAPAQTRQYMGRLVDDSNRYIDVLAAFEKKYQEHVRAQ